MLARRTPEHVRAAVRHVDSRSSTPFAEIVRTKLKAGPLQRACLMLVEEPVEYLAHMLHAACHGLRETPALKELGHPGGQVVSF